MAKHRRSKTARKVKGFGKISFFVLILSFAIFTALLVTAAVHMPKKSGNTVCIDAGHGGYDVGATNGERYEKDDNLKVALEVQKYLEKYGVNVVMIRDDDSFLELDERCAKANNAKADMYVSLHRNSYDGDISGVEVWVNNSEPEYDTKLAQNILDDLEKVGISENRGVQYGYVGNSGVNYYINADTVMPSCLVELGFITEDIDNKLFDEHLTEYGQAIADGIVQTAVDVGLVDESGKRLMSEQLISPEKPVNNKDSSSAADAMTTPMETDSSADVYNTQENEWY